MNAKLRRRDYAILLALGLVLFLGVTFFQRVPGYTDAEYYFSGGVRLFQGEGFTEMILWNYLDDPAGLPHPSHAYWMPLPSLLAAGGMALFQRPSFFAARFPFILLASLIAPLTALLSDRLGQDRRGAFLAGLLGLFSGFYFIYTTLTEGFALVMILGAVFFLTAFGREVSDLDQLPSPYFFLFPGVVAGLMHLTRAEGLLWVAAGIVTAIWLCCLKNKTALSNTLWVLACFFLGYLLVMGPWYYRNWQDFGRIMPPGGTRALWLENYNQIFQYPANQLNATNWIASGWTAIIKDRFAAVLANLKTAFAVQGSVFLLPLMMAGFWKLRRDRRVILGVGLWLAIFGVMSVVFPYAGARGGFFHSGAALQPLLWASVPFGLDAFVGWGSKKRDWDSRMATSVFGGGLVVMSILLTGILFFQRVLGTDFDNPVWQESWKTQLAFEGALVEHGAQAGDSVMINNPAGLFAATGRAAIVTPDGNLETASLVAQRYGVSYLILEANHVEGLRPLYEAPGDRSGLEYLTSVDDAYLFEFVGE
ncbi:MAG: hypothetical protein K8R77_10875 [Anaerolineaceae bacterium]|nr:hypothetical protein [Anaerolineaceae bacterium]